MDFELLNRKNITDNIWSFSFKSDKKLDYISGQFIELFLINKNTKKIEKRWFTLSSSPTENLLTITTRIDNIKISNFKKILLTMKINDRVQISQAMGDFVLPRNKDQKLTFIALGIGITPYRSMIKFLIDTQSQRNINFYYIYKYSDKIPFEEDIKLYEFNRFLSVNELRIDSLIGGISENVKDNLIYIAGPEHKVSKLKDSFLKLNIDSNNIVVDYFQGYDLT